LQLRNEKKKEKHVRVFFRTKRKSKSEDCYIFV